MEHLTISSAKFGQTNSERTAGRVEYGLPELIAPPSHKTLLEPIDSYGFMESVPKFDLTQCTAFFNQLYLRWLKVPFEMKGAVIGMLAAMLGDTANLKVSARN